MCYITEEKTGNFIVVVLFVLGIIFIWGNFKFFFFNLMINGYTPLIEGHFKQD